MARGKTLGFEPPVPGKRRFSGTFSAQRAGGCFPAKGVLVQISLLFCTAAHWRKWSAAVLVAIAIPVFTAQLEKSKEATDIANVRSAYAEVMAEALTQGGTKEVKAVVTLKQGQADWQGSNPTATLAKLGATYTGFDTDPADVAVSGIPSAGGSGTVTYKPDTAGGAPTITIVFA